MFRLEGFTLPDLPRQANSSIRSSPELLGEVGCLESVALIVTGLNTPEINCLKPCQFRQSRGLLNGPAKGRINILKAKGAIPDAVAIRTKASGLDLAQERHPQRLGINARSPQGIGQLTGIKA